MAASISGGLVLCPPQCAPSCIKKHHPLLVVVLNCADAEDKTVMMQRLYQLQHVVKTYEDEKNWKLDDPVPDHMEAYQYPVIHWACALGRMTALLWLLEHGADPCNTNAPDGQTALHRAVHQLGSVHPREATEKFKQMVVQMQRAVQIQDIHGNTVLHECGNQLVNMAPKQDFYVDCVKSVVDLIKMLNTEDLTASLASQNDEGNTIVHLLCQDKFLFLIKDIFACTTANFNVANSQGLTPMDLAQASGALKVASFLTKQLRRDGTLHSASLLSGTGEPGKQHHKLSSTLSSHGATAGQATVITSGKRPSSSKYAIGRASPIAKDGSPSPVTSRKRQLPDLSEKEAPPKRQQTHSVNTPTVVVARLPAETTTQSVDSPPQTAEGETRKEDGQSSGSPSISAKKSEDAKSEHPSSPPDYFRQGADFIRYLAGCSDEKKLQILQMVEKDRDSYAEKMNEATKSSAEIDCQMSRVKEDQQKTVSEIQRLLDHLAKLQEEETALRKDISRLQNLKDTAVCNMRQLKDKLGRCQGALAVVESLQ